LVQTQDLALKHHPDRNKGKDSKKLFVKISKAYEILKDPMRRQHYDLTGATLPPQHHQTYHRGFGHGAFYNPFHLFSEVFPDLTGPRKTNHKFGTFTHTGVPGFGMFTSSSSDSNGPSVGSFSFSSSDGQGSDQKPHSNGMTQTATCDQKTGKCTVTTTKLFG
jgi:DnaJ-class molecular chaperone